MCLACTRPQVQFLVARKKARELIPPLPVIYFHTANYTRLRDLRAERSSFYSWTSNSVKARKAILSLPHTFSWGGSFGATGFNSKIVPLQGWCVGAGEFTRGYQLGLSDLQMGFSDCLHFPREQWMQFLVEVHARTSVVFSGHPDAQNFISAALCWLSKFLRPAQIQTVSDWLPSTNGKSSRKLETFFISYLYFVQNRCLNWVDAATRRATQSGPHTTLLHRMKFWEWVAEFWLDQWLGLLLESSRGGEFPTGRLVIDHQLWHLSSEFWFK